MREAQLDCRSFWSGNECCCVSSYQEALSFRLLKLGMSLNLGVKILCVFFLSISYLHKIVFVLELPAGAGTASRLPDVHFHWQDCGLILSLICHCFVCLQLNKFFRPVAVGAGYSMSEPQNQLFVMFLSQVYDVYIDAVHAVLQTGSPFFWSSAFGLFCALLPCVVSSLWGLFQL